MLPRLGFRIVEAPSGSKGLELLRTSADPIGLVLLDMTMPGLSGGETFAEIRKLHPDLPVVLMSGYDEEEAIRDFKTSDLAGFLRKPFLQRELSAILRRALDDQRT
jgi:CheY-like chemotaxis protein